jgi:glutamyl-tRNA synthetase
VVDDHLMEISDVIRGEEWLPSLPLHYLLYEAFGWQDSRPNFAHLSLLLKPDGKGKLSKRDGDRLGFPVFPLKWVNAEGEVSRGYREDGYYPEAFINLLAMLGWNPGTEQELFSLDELVQAFSLERVVKSGARFNPDKAKWFNQEYLRMRPTEALIADFRALNGEKVAAFSDEYIGKVLEMMKERAHFANELWDLTAFFFEAPQTYDEASVAKFWKDEVKEIIPKVREFVSGIEPFDKETVETSLHELITSNEWPMGKVMNTIRLFLVGVSKGPGIADMMAIFGKEETLRRIDVAIAKLG